MADAAARYMVAFVRVCAAARVRIRVARASGGEGFRGTGGLDSGTFGSSARSTWRRRGIVGH